MFTRASRHVVYASIAAFTICALSLTVLTGWAGQLSLGQMAFAGLGAFTGAALTRGLTIDWFLYIRFEPMPFALSILLAAVFVAASPRSSDPGRCASPGSFSRSAHSRSP